MHATLEPDVEMAALGQKLGHGILNPHFMTIRSLGFQKLILPNGLNVTLLVSRWNENRPGLTAPLT